MKKSIAILTFIFTLTSTTIPVFAAETTNITKTTNISNIQSNDPVFSPYIVHSYTRTLPKTYTSYPVPTSIPHREYNDEMGAWFSGTLYLQSVTRKGNNWEAIYSGNIVGVI